MRTIGLILFWILLSRQAIFSNGQLKPPIDLDIGSTFEEDKFFKQVQKTLKENKPPVPNLPNLDKFNKTYETCFTPKGEAGHCKMVPLCDWDELKQNPSNYFDYFCIIEGSVVGVCCPDNLQEKQADSRARAVASPARPNVKQHTDCGLNGKLLSRIREGQRSNLNDWPWMAVLLRKVDYQNFCGGVLLNRRYVLTAAHCVNKKVEADIVVRLGEYDFRTPNETEYIDFIISQFIKHEDYDPANQRHDIALIKIHRQAVYNRFIRPICLPYTEAKENETAIVAGWGMLFYGGPLSDILMEVPVPVWNINECASKYVQPIFKTNICAAGYEGDKDSCQGDSGGPLLKQLPSGRWITIGIVSWGISCGQRDLPGVYTRVESYMNWIAGHIADSNP